MARRVVHRFAGRSRFVEVTQRGVLPVEEESQRETASDTP